MKASLSVFGWMLLTMAIGHAALAGDDQDKDKPAEIPKEQAVVDYDSETHGAVQVTSASEKPGDSFNVLKDGEREFIGPPNLLGGTLELAPGDYVVDVNRTLRKVKIEAGKKTVLLTGDLAVESKRAGAFWIPKQGKETRLASNPPTVNTRIALFPGKYSLYLNVGAGVDLKSLGMAEVKAGQKTVVKEK
jgi:hypothetical protein